ncbi:conserved hypothetical protein, partial [Trichinella spiralis]|uniref:hypothetical protein n=1 Tax=Trichinella spiralis TaxID=6334 RepID=UPI0001EFE660
CVHFARLDVRKKVSKNFSSWLNHTDSCLPKTNQDNVRQAMIAKCNINLMKINISAWLNWKTRKHSNKNYKIITIEFLYSLDDC